MGLSGRERGRLVGLLFLAVVIVAVGLLIAGYGVAVGVGALVGLVLGFVAGTFGLLWLGRGSGRSITFGGMAWSSLSEEPAAELMAEVRELGELSGVDTGPLLSVLPVLARAEAGGLEAELVTVELHEAGLSMTLDVASRPGTVPPASMALVSVVDDAGTSYRAAAQGQGGSPGRMRYAVTAIPAPPPRATRLEVTVERFLDPFPGGRRQATGPWRFSVVLPGGEGHPRPA